MRAAPWSVVCALAVAFLAGCASLGTTQADLNPYECPAGVPNDPARQPRPSPAPVVKTVELTDLGELVNRCQWTDVLYELQVKRPEVVLLYVHGWKHDGKDDDRDKIEFGDLVRKMTAAEQAGRGRHVVGIYVGWPGATLRVPLLQELTYWSRQRAADRISQSAVVTKLIGAINSVRQLAGHRAEDTIVLMGHSFGARILLTATSQLILFDVQMKHPGHRFGTYRPVQGPADLIVLLNPAVEASAYTALDSVRRYQERINERQEPLMLTISTSNDLATRIAFPLGQALGLALHERQQTTLGNYEPYFTHTLGPSQPVGPRPGLPWYDKFCRSGICLSRRDDDRQARNPFIVASTTEDVLDGHNGIWKPDFIQWLQEFFREADRERIGTAKR